MPKEKVMVEGAVSAKQMKELWRQIEEGHITGSYFQDFLDHNRGLTKENPFLRRITDKPLVVDAVSGEETLANATDMFAWIDNDFKNWGTDEPGVPTGEIEVVVHEMVKDGTFMQLFSSLGDIEKLCLTQAQIKNFVKKHRRWLRTGGCGIFFLFWPKGEFFVAYVSVFSDDLYVHVDRLEGSVVWPAGDRHRLVVPQLA